MTRKITVFFGVAVFFAVFFGSLPFSQSAIADRLGNEENKVVICHVPAIDPDNPQTIAVEPKDVENHILGHEGDHEGECETRPSSCDECFAVVNTNLENCGLDSECQNKALSTFGDCTLTCEGDLFQVFPENCVNKTSPIMSECSATNFEEINQCAVEWNFILEACSMPG